tara:strand:+ start:792 stop:1007 length:216 start_codon:yes stop_codon:yes gene_type:complete
METLVIAGVVAAGFYIGKSMSNPEDYQQETAPKKRHKKHKKDKKYIVYPTDIVENIGNIGKSDEIRSGSRV